MRYKVNGRFWFFFVLTVIVILLGSIIVLPVRCIPWEAITCYVEEGNYPCIRVKIKQVQASVFAKVLLWIMGYHFCYGFVKPQVAPEDIAKYEHKFSMADNEKN